ncbi:hypothetical protein Ana3638_10285 [Anaerocolumna sedimenticola]|uniref:Uncharacterized protein n=1 Tax=Anaerocolumna sedimenticola TaxID=2696063 RepID=A0A6P1TMM4_9FIRM|nr:hypothetical protein [Anaerocolumna sedimenticola]QHQ61106.1 hypothetical protein Ana3638_10285 [Anaerocolumna sedimenticola]
MLICPVCKNEYQEGYKTCSDCKCDLIEIPDVIAEKSKPVKAGMLIPFLLGLLIILCSPIISYQFTADFFIPDGNGIFDPAQFIWMLNAFHYSLLLVGSIICLPPILYWFKNRNSQ